MKELQLIQSALKAPKSNTNNFGKYKYRSCEDILEAVKPLLAEQQCSLVINDEIVLIGERYYVKATATIENGAPPEVGIISVSAYAREPQEKKGMDLAQLTGATSSYARKYALNGLFAIDDTKDADTMKPTVATPKQPKRADVNKALLACETIEQFDKVQNGFKGKYGDIMNQPTGHKDEFWARLFNTHSNRINKIPPVNANQTPGAK